MKKLLTMVMAVAVLGLAAMVQAYPTLTGPSGLAVVPTGNMSPNGLSIAADARDLDGSTSYPGRAVISFGVAELGGYYDPYSDNFAPIEQSWGAFAKIGIGRFLGGNAALGAQFLRNEEPSITGTVNTDYSQGFFAWTSNFNASDDPNIFSSLAFTWGANWTQIDPPVGENVARIRGFAGLQFNVTPDIALLAEYQTRAEELGDTDPITAYTARFGIGEGFGAQVGTTNAFQLIGTPDHQLFGGVFINF